MQTQPVSIRRTLLVRLLGPLLLLTLLAGASAYGLARHFTQVVLDQWLYDSAIALANRVREDDGRVRVDLPDEARQILEWDVVDRFYYEVTTADGKRLAANADLPRPPGWTVAPGATTYFETTFNEASVRLLAVGIQLEGGGIVAVKVAETLNKRGAITAQVLWISMVLSLAMVAGCATLAWYGIGSGIGTMERAVGNARARHARSPLAPVPLDSDMPAEVVPLLDEINDLIADLSAAHHLNQRFVADAAHQLRTPLATLRVQLETALRERNPERHSRALNDAVAALGRMSHLLHQLLTLARADGSDAADVGSADIGLIGREEVERRLEEAVALGVDLGYSGPSHPVIVRGRGELLREAVSNLVDNALRYGGSGGQVTVGVQPQIPEIFVEDLGPGIPPASRSKALDRFHRLPGSAGDGCGLGLSIVEEIARRSGASLRLEDATPAGGLRARLLFGTA